MTREEALRMIEAEFASLSDEEKNGKLFDGTTPAQYMESVRSGTPRGENHLVAYIKGKDMAQRLGISPGELVARLLQERKMKLN